MHADIFFIFVFQILAFFYIFLDLLKLSVSVTLTSFLLRNPMFQIGLPMSKQVCASAGLLLLPQLLQIFGGCEILAAPDSIETSETLSRR